MITILGAVFVVLAAVSVVLRPEYLPWLLSAGVPFSSTAGVNVAGQSISVYTIVSVVIVVLGLQAVRIRGLLDADLSARPGLRYLIAFGGWALLVTVAAPVIFAGTKVINPRDGIDAGVQNPDELVPSISNFAQLSYLFVGIAVVVAIASMRTLSPYLPGVGFAVGTAMSSIKSLLPEGLQTLLFDNSLNFAYTTGTFNGIERMRGVFSEPSALGAFSVAGAVYFVVLASTTKGPLRYVSIGLGIWSFTNAVLSFSGGALVSGLIILGLIAARGLLRCVVGRSALSPSAVVATLLTVPTLVIIGPVVFGYVNLLLSDKVDSSSYENRSAADSFSIDLAGRVYGIGVGVGSNRPSSFFASLLAATGVLGVLLLGAAILVIALRALRDRRFHAAVWALISILISKIVAGPDLSDPPMWLLIAVCAGAAWRSWYQPPGEPPAGAVTRAVPVVAPGLPVVAEQASR